MKKLFYVAGLVGVALCAAVPVQAQDLEAGKILFEKHCATCHGLDAKGKGPMAGVLLVPPTDLSRLSQSEGGGFPVLRVVQRIDGRDPLVSHGSPMPVYGDFFAGSDAALKTASGQPVMTSQPIVDLVAYLKGMQE